MSEMKRSRWRPVAAITLLVAAIVGWWMFARPEPAIDTRAAPAAPQAKPAPAAPVKPPVLATPPALGRADLIAAAERAAAAFALGRPAPAENVALAGRRFELLLPFGCGGAADSAEEIGDFGWFYDGARGTLRAQATPQIWTEAPWAAALAGSREVEAIEGFWIRRPWIRDAACPVPADEADGPTLPNETVGIARLFEPDSRRATRRNGEPYRLTAKMSAEELPGADGLRLVIEGRLAADPARQPVACWSAGPDRRPICILIARIERVAITRSDGVTTLAEWAD